MKTTHQFRSIDLLEDKIVECNCSGFSPDFIDGLNEVLELIEDYFVISRLIAWDAEAEASYGDSISDADRDYYRGVLRALRICLVEAK